MSMPSVAVSSKYQVVIPKAARRTMGLDKNQGLRLRVKKVTADEIIFCKEPSLDDFLGQYGESFPKNAATELRAMRNKDWE